MNRRSQGLSLIELLVALVIGLVLVGGMAQIFLSNKQAYQLTEELARIQENARYAVNVLSRDLRMAGYWGCSSRVRSMMDDPEEMRVNVAFDDIDTPGIDTPHLTPWNGIEGWEANNTAPGEYSIVADASVDDVQGSSNWNTATTANNLEAPVLLAVLEGDTIESVANSDVIRVWQVQGDPVIADVSAATPNLIDLEEDLDFLEGDLLMLTDCASVDVVFACGNSTANQVNLTQGCSAGISNDRALLNTSGGHLDKLRGYTYYVGKRGGVASNPPALFRSRIGLPPDGTVTGQAEELVEGVESLQILYGEDRTMLPDGVADRYVTANDVADWRNVVSVRVAMLMQGARPGSAIGFDLLANSYEDNTFNFNGDEVTSNDGRLRYAYVETISLRNRVQ